VAETKTKTSYTWGTGRRKTSVARVRLYDGSGKVVINDRDLNDYFTEEKDRNAVLGPLELTEMRSKLDVAVNVQGGGFTGQAGAICRSRRQARSRRRAARRHEQEAPRFRLSHPRRPDEGTQEVRPKGRSQSLPILEALIMSRHARRRVFEPAGYLDIRSTSSAKRRDTASRSS